MKQTEDIKTEVSKIFAELKAKAPNRMVNLNGE